MAEQDGRKASRIAIGWLSRSRLRERSGLHLCEAASGFYFFSRFNSNTISFEFFSVLNSLGRSFSLSASA